MSTLSSSYLTLADHAKLKDPSGRTAVVVEMMNQTNDVLIDMPFIESNKDSGHQITMRTGLPTPTWRKMNKGVLPSKGRTAQFVEAVGMLEAWSEIDVEI